MKRKNSVHELISYANENSVRCIASGSDATGWVLRADGASFEIRVEENWNRPNFSGKREVVDGQGGTEKRLRLGLRLGF
jgi:hypothetical protein